MTLPSWSTMVKAINSNKVQTNILNIKLWLMLKHFLTVPCLTRIKTHHAKHQRVLTQVFQKWILLFQKLMTGEKNIQVAISHLWILALLEEIALHHMLTLLFQLPKIEFACNQKKKYNCQHKKFLIAILTVLDAWVDM